ncbi:MAG TPA: hypothetical protein VKV73_33400 [Chloroflexota bacterium]|nr:hypothetical protein [Chloroflexota bacterium]
MHRLTSLRPLSSLLAALFVLSLITSACGAGDGAPSAPGQYSVQKDSVHFDGDRYQLYWADNNGSLHHMDTQKLRLVRDPDRTFLEVPQGGDPILHLREDEPITVAGQDHQGAFSSPWFPFLAGAALGNALGGGFGAGRGGGQTIIINNPAPGERSYDVNTPTYRYPPTGSFGRDDSLLGSLDTSKPQAPDYSKIQPSPYATAGKSSGTGGGVAASNKAGGGAAGAVNANSGQSGGTGSGVAASSKGGFANGSQSFSNTSGSSAVGAGSRGVLGGGASSTGATSSKPSTSIGSSSKGFGGARAPSVGRH